MNPTRTVHPAGTLKSSTFQNVTIHNRLRLSNTLIGKEAMYSTSIEDVWVAQIPPPTDDVDRDYHIQWSTKPVRGHNRLVYRRSEYGVTIPTWEHQVPVVPVIFEGHCREETEQHGLSLTEDDVSFLRGDAPIAYSADMSGPRAPYCTVSHLSYLPASRLLRAVAWVHVHVAKDEHLIYAAYSRQNSGEDIVSWWARSASFQMSLFIGNKFGEWNRHEVVLRGQRLLRRLGASAA